MLDSDIISLLIPVVPKLLLPSEIIYGGDIILDESFNYVTSMDISCDQSDDDLSLERGKFASDELCELSELSLIGLVPLLEGEGVSSHVIDRELCLTAPLDLCDGCYYLTEMR